METSNGYFHVIQQSSKMALTSATDLVAMNRIESSAYVNQR